MIRVLAAEMLKLKASLALLVAISAPLMLFILTLVIHLSGDAPENWGAYVTSGAAIWAFFLFPMTVTALTALMGFIEHRSHYWAHLLALPVPRWRIFAGKIALTLMLTGMAALGIWLAAFGAGLAGSALAPGEALTGAPPYALAAGLLARMFLAGWLMIAIQLWVALRFANFVVPIVTGIGGTFVAVAATSAKAGGYFPWLMPVNMLAAEPERATLALWAGLIGGIVLFVLMSIDLSRRDWT